MTTAIRTRRLAKGLVFSALLVAASPARSAEIHVTDLNDNAATTTTCTLRQAVRSANENTAIGACEAGQLGGTDQILVPPGTHLVNLGSNGEDSALTGDLDLLESVDIRGTATDLTIILAQLGAVDRLFDVHAGISVVMEQVTLFGGNAADTSGQGGDIRLIATGTLSLSEVHVALGHADTGGGIYSDGTLTLLDSHITDNTAQDAGSTGNHGGGVAHSAGAGNLTIADTEFSRNSAEEDGAGLWVAGGAFTMQRSALRDNVAGGNGGGLHVSTGNYLVTYTEFAGNRANAGGGVYLLEMGTLQRCAFADNTALGAGGGVHDAFGAFIRNSTLTGNVAAQGGGVFANATQTLLDADTIAMNSGGGVHNQKGASFEVTIVAQNTGGNCTGAQGTVGEYNMEDTNTCGFVSSVNNPNFPNTNPKLGPFTYHGGPTRSMSLLSGSPAIDAVSSQVRPNCESNTFLDQRGHARGRPRVAPDLFLCDIGAFEVSPPFRVNTLADGADADLADDVCETSSPGVCTLRAAIQQANAIPGVGEIELGPGNHVLSISGTGEDASATGDLDIDPPLSIRGAGAALTSVSGGALDRVFDVGSPAGHLNNGVERTLLRDLTITGGDSGSVNGGAILLRTFPLDIEGVRLIGNHGDRGSAISSSLGTFFGAGDLPVRLLRSTVEGNTGGMALFLHEARIERSSLLGNVNTVTGNGGAGEFLRVEFVNSTVSGNHAGATGALFAGRAVVDSSTIHANSADSAPGGLFLLERSAFRNSIVSENLVSGTSNNCSSNQLAIASAGHNLTDTAVGDCELDDATDTTSTNPQLGALANNGGTMRTHLPLAGSPAIDLGDSTSCPVSDQRGVGRPQDGDTNGSFICDIGAVEIPEPGFLAGLAAGCALLAGLSRRRRRLDV